MSESVLNAIIQLFALTANANGSKAQGRLLVTALLKQHLSPRFINDYLEVYDNYIYFFKRDTPSGLIHSPVGKKHLGEYVEKVCSQLRKGLPQADRLVVFIKLLEYINHDLKVTDIEEEIFNTVAACFSLINS